MTPKECIEWLEGRSPPHVMDAAIAHLRRLARVEMEREVARRALDDCHQEIIALERENTRLRAALERIAGGEYADTAENVARESLEPVEGMPAQEGSE